MKRFITITFLVAVVSFPFVLLSKQSPIYAASPVQQATPVADATGAKLYANDCAICHGEKMEGNLPAFPPLAGVGRHLSPEEITNLIHHGRGRMPAFTKLQDSEIKALVQYLDNSQILTAEASGVPPSTAMTHASPLAEMGSSLFQQNCAFCHGRDTAGGETGPDLTRSKLVAADVGGDKIGEVVRNGRPEKKMPRFNFSEQELSGIVAFIHAQSAKAQSMQGHRRGVDVADLQTGNATAGKQYFDGNCASCHSATGDLAGIASRYEGLALERRMLYPEDAKSKATVTLPSGQTITGILAYKDEFTIALRDESGRYHSWKSSNVKYTVDSPVDDHVNLFPKYTDADIHNLMAYLQTLR